MLSPHSNHRQPWNADEIEELCRYMSVRKPVREIAAIFGRSQEAVRAKAHQLDRMTGVSLRADLSRSDARGRETEIAGFLGG